jgi:hypothetical protein
MLAKQCENSIRRQLSYNVNQRQATEIVGEEFGEGCGDGI